MRSFRIFAAAMAAVAALGLSAAQVTTVETARGKGRNADYRAAIYDALSQAMSQVGGMSLQESRETLLDALQASQASTLVSTTSVSEVSEALKQSVSVATKGRVQSYKVLSEEFDQTTGQWVVEVEAKFPGKYIVGRDPNNLRRMVVMPFRYVGSETVSVYGTAVKPSPNSEEIARRLNEDLAQTRRFTMLDREFNSEIQNELSRLYMDNASSGDMGRFNQLLVTDYMVIGSVRMYSSPTPVSNQYTGRTTVADGSFIEVSYRILLVPTSQLKWANTVKIPYSACAGGSVEEMLSTGMTVVAKQISDEIIANIYPMRVTAKNAFELVFNQGGKSVRAGQVFDIFNAGEAIIDVTTGESLGAEETMIARAQITRITPKMSYAVVIEGTPLEQIPIGAIARPTARDDAPAYQSATPSVASPVKVAPGGTVVAPWARRPAGL